MPPLGSGVTFSTQHSTIVVDKLVADGALVDFASRDPGKAPLRFEVHKALLHDVAMGKPIRVPAKAPQSAAPASLRPTASLEPGQRGPPGETPISGEFVFEQANLGVYGGIGGISSSKGKYGGQLKHIDISGSTNVPDFVVKSGGHKVKLVTQFDAYVDAIHGDTFLKHVNARFGQTTLAVTGSVAGAKNGKGKIALLSLTSRQGRIEDLLGLFVKSSRSPMSGAVAFKAEVEIPSGKEPFLQKVSLKGNFGVGEGTFSQAETQKSVNELSAGARGEKMEDAETVLTDLKGVVVLKNGIATFSQLSFGVPGAGAHMYGTYNLLNEKVDLHGRMRVDTKISKTASGVKSFLLKAIDPIFKKKNRGEVVPVHITGTYENPQFGLDLTKSKPAEPQNK